MVLAIVRCCRLEGATYRKIFCVASQQKYCREVKADGKRTDQPYDPQPTPDSLIVVDRYYATLAANDAYKCHVTWLAVNGDGVGSRAMYEYIGQHVASAPHGNTKNSSSAEPFGRTPAATMERVGEMLKSNRPQDVYNQLSKMRSWQPAERRKPQMGIVAAEPSPTKSSW